MKVEFNKANFIGMEINGYRWAFYDSKKDLHSFTKQIEPGKWAELKAKPEDFTNGNIQYFAENGISRK